MRAGLSECAWDGGEACSRGNAVTAVCAGSAVLALMGSVTARFLRCTTAAGWERKTGRCAGCRHVQVSCNDETVSHSHCACVCVRPEEQ